jgi:hypothetical protein
VIFGKDWSFVQNPRAASSAVTDALLPFTNPQHPRDLPAGKPSKHFIPRAGIVPLKLHRLGVVRNPYDRLVSAWCYLRQRRSLPDFRTWVLHDEWKVGARPCEVDFLRTPQIEWLAGCNKVFRFETLNEEFDKWALWHLDRPATLARTNQSPRSGGHAAYYLRDTGGFDTELIDEVRRRFWFDFEIWGYKL